MIQRAEAEKVLRETSPPPEQAQFPSSDLDRAESGYAAGSLDSGSKGTGGAVARLQRIRPFVEPVLRSEGVPAELAAVILVESGARPFAQSPKQARGLWQFIPATAERYGLTVSPELDERVHLDHSTRAAARYLRDLFRQFGDWRLALAAYNAGEGAVSRAIEKARTTDFSVISAKRLLPAETRAYVPAVLRAIQQLGGSTRALLQPKASLLAPRVERGSS